MKNEEERKQQSF